MSTSRRTVVLTGVWSSPAIMVAAAAPSLAASAKLASTMPDPYAAVGQPVSKTLAATGGVGNYTYATVTSIPGLTLGSDGTISGTPAVQGSQTLTFTVTDASGLTQTFSQTIDVGPSVLVAENDLLADMNSYRAGLGLAPYKRDANLDPIAHDNSTDEVARQSSGHFNGSLPKVQNAGYGWAGEDAAQSFTKATPDALAQEVLSQWTGEPHSYTDYVSAYNRSAAYSHDEAEAMFFSDAQSSTFSQRTGQKLYPQESGHRINIEAPSAYVSGSQTPIVYQSVGVAILRDPVGGDYYSTVDFGGNF